MTTRETIHDIRRRVAADLTASARRTAPRTTVDVPPCRVVTRDPATTPDPSDEARWAAERPARRVAMRGEV
jgi:hypothetical protein